MAIAKDKLQNWQRWLVNHSKSILLINQIVSAGEEVRTEKHELNGLAPETYSTKIKGWIIQEMHFNDWFQWPELSKG